MSENPTHSVQKSWRMLSGDDLKAQRILLGLTQAELARILGVQRTTLVETEQKSCDQLSVLWRLAIRTLRGEPELFLDSGQIAFRIGVMKGPSND
jgi:DNA-binding XRE family transcriptional regulator